MSGTLCNLSCHHCFIGCHPQNETFGYISLEEIRRRLRESVLLGVKEYYFTGGEPFLHRDIVEILIETLQYGPATVLTNGTVLKDNWLTRLATAHRESVYCLEFRVSIDGFSAAMNDPIRGDGTFARAMRGVLKLVEFGFLPIITAARTWPEEEDAEIIGQFIATLQSAGYERPRLKVLPTLHLGAEENRTRGYEESERVSLEMMDGFDQSQLICHHSRIVTDRGVQVCPILIESSDSVLGTTLAEGCRPFQIGHGACFTCYRYGAICSNPSSSLWKPADLARENTQ